MAEDGHTRAQLAPKKRAFIAAYRQSGNIRASTEAAGIDRRTYYKWMEHDLVFAAAARVAREEFADLVEAKVTQLGLRDSSLGALVVQLKLLGRYRETVRSEITGADGNPIDISVESKPTLVSRIAGLAARVGENELAQRPT